MKATLGGKDAQSVESAKTTYPDFKIASNSFKVIEGLVLELGGEKQFSPFFVTSSRMHHPIFQLTHRANGLWPQVNFPRIFFGPETNINHKNFLKHVILFHTF